MAKIALWFLLHKKLALVFGYKYILNWSSGTKFFTSDIFPVDNIGWFPYNLQRSMWLSSWHRSYENLAMQMPVFHPIADDRWTLFSACRAFVSNHMETSLPSNKSISDLIVADLCKKISDLLVNKLKGEVSFLKQNYCELFYFVGFAVPLSNQFCLEVSLSFPTVIKLMLSPLFLRVHKNMRIIYQIIADLTPSCFGSRWGGLSIIFGIQIILTVASMICRMQIFVTDATDD